MERGGMHREPDLVWFGQETVLSFLLCLAVVTAD